MKAVFSKVTGLNQAAVEEAARFIYELNKSYYEVKRVSIYDVFDQIWSMCVASLKKDYPDGWKELVPDIKVRVIPNVDLLKHFRMGEAIEMVKILDDLMYICTNLDDISKYEVFMKIKGERDELCHDIVMNLSIYDESSWE